MKKKIGVSFSRTNFKYYWDWFTAADLGTDLELVLLSFEQNNIEDFAVCDGFLLTGGVDIDPTLYNGATDYLNQPHVFESDRDAFETNLYEYSQLHNAPLLAICRGMQLINVLEGGTLVQDLGDANSVHRKHETDRMHSVSVHAGSLLHEVVGTASGIINSAHHQALEPASLGTNLAVNARGEDAVIEGLEFHHKEGKAFMLALQWHPERMPDRALQPFSENIKQRFLQEVRNTDSKRLAIINPANETVIAQLRKDTANSLEKKFQLLQEGQQHWQGVSLAERINVLQRFAALLQEEREQLATVLISEVGKPVQQARNEIAGAVTRINWLTKNANQYLQDETMTDEDGLQEKIIYEPLGVVCNISAWNYPYLVGVNVFVPALLGGNAVFYKPSEHATLTGLQIEKLLKKAGVPDNVFQTAIGAGAVGNALLELPLDGYFFTGSYKTGQYIYEKLAPKMVPVQCELGGKDPLYVADDVTDIKAVAAATADGAFYNNGQSCCAVERIYVHQNIYDAYVAAFVAEVQSYKMGAPDAEGIYIGPLSRREQLQILQDQVTDAVAKGATVLTNADKPDRPGFYFAPTVLTNVTHDMTVMKDESFGPLIGIMCVKDDAEAVRLMQDTEYGLTASVYSSSEARAISILKQLNTGTGYWNCCDRVSPALPWSGRKHSGFGSTLSHAGLRAFVRPKSYHLRQR